MWNDVFLLILCITFKHTIQPVIQIPAQYLVIIQASPVIILLCHAATNGCESISIAVKAYYIPDEAYIGITIIYICCDLPRVLGM